MGRWLRAYLGSDGQLHIREGDPHESIWAGLDDADIDPAFVREVHAYLDGHRHDHGGDPGPAGPLWPVIEDTFHVWDRLGRTGLDAMPWPSAAPTCAAPSPPAYRRGLTAPLSVPSRLPGRSLSPMIKMTSRSGGPSGGVTVPAR